MTAIGKVTSKGMTIGDIVLLERSSAGGCMPARCKGKTTIAARVTDLGTSKDTSRQAGRRNPIRYDITLCPLGSPVEASTTETIDTSASQTWWLATAATHWAKFLAEKGITPPR